MNVKGMESIHDLYTGTVVSIYSMPYQEFGEESVDLGDKFLSQSCRESRESLKNSDKAELGTT